MKKCPYCTPEDGDIGNFPEKALLDKPIYIGKMYIDNYEPFISLTHKGAFLGCVLFEEDHHKKINYCPMCGKDLNKYIKELEESNGR